MAKKFLVIGLGICCGLTSFAQNTLGIIGGVQYTSASYKIRDKDQSVSSKTGGQLGLTLKIPFESQLYFSPMINYSLKGFTVQLTDVATPPGADVVNNDLTIHTVDIAPLLHIDFSKKPSHLFARFGPAIDVAFMGTEKLVYKSGESETRDMKFGSTAYGPITSSAIAHLGYETKGGFFVYSFYQHGLGSMNNNDDGPRIRHRILGFSLGFYFSRKNPNVIDTKTLD